MWEDILKAPLFQGKNFKQPENKEGDNFEWLQTFTVNDLNVKFVSNDASTRATLRLSLNTALHWKLNLFVVNEPLRGKGLGEESLLELIYLLRDNEKDILKSILKSYQKFTGVGNKPDKLEIALANPNTPLDIKLEDVDPEVGSFWDKMIRRYNKLGLKKSNDIIKVQISNVKQDIKTSQRTLPEPEPEKKCIQIYKEIDDAIRAFCMMANEVGKSVPKFIKPSWGENITLIQNKTRMFDAHWMYLPIVTHNPGEDKYTTSYLLDFVWSSADNMTEENACELLNQIKLRHISQRIGQDMAFQGVNEYYFDTVSLNNIMNNPASDVSAANIQLTFGFTPPDLLFQFQEKLIGAGTPTNKDWVQYKAKIDKLFRDYNSLKLFIIAKADSWKGPSFGKDLNKEDLGKVTEYHGTMNLEKVLKEGIDGGKTKNRSNKHIPIKLRKVETITYTTNSYEEALEFVKRRAKQLGVPENEVGVVGVKGTNLPKAVEHKDIRIKGITLVREGGIAAKYLERVEDGI